MVALLAFYADIYNLVEATRTKLRGARLPPSVIVHSGGGHYAYRLLDELTTDLNKAQHVFRPVRTGGMGRVRLSQFVISPYGGIYASNG